MANKPETPYQKRKRLEREKRARELNKKAAEDAISRAEKKRVTSAASKPVGSRQTLRPSTGSKTSGFGYGPIAGVTKKTNTSSTQTAPRNLPVGTTGKGKSATSSGSTGSDNSSSSSRNSASSTKPVAPKNQKTVDQSRTEWVAKGTRLSDGSIVSKGYLAQKGKPEKRVTANVKIQTDTSSGKKAGQTYSYNKGKSGSQVKKKK